MLTPAQKKNALERFAEYLNDLDDHSEDTDARFSFGATGLGSTGGYVIDVTVKVVR